MKEFSSVDPESRRENDRNIALSIVIQKNVVYLWKINEYLIGLSCFAFCVFITHSGGNKKATHSLLRKN